MYYLLFSFFQDDYNIMQFVKIIEVYIVICTDN